MPRATSFNDPILKIEIGIFSSMLKGKARVGQYEFDVSTLRDPSGQVQFALVDGTFPQVRDWVKKDRRVPIIVKDCLLLSDDLMKPKKKNGEVIKPLSVWLSFSFVDHHGKWAAPSVAEIVADALSEAGYVVAVHHACLQK